MIRLLLLTVVPLILPFAGWYAWRVFSGEPKIDPGTGDQVSPDFAKAPTAKLFVAGLLLMFVTVGGFLIVHDRIADAPYKPIDVDEAERRGFGPGAPANRSPEGR